MSQVDSAGPPWRKSSRCDSNACVEVALGDGVVAIRDNTQPGRHLAFDSVSWKGLLRALHAGQFSR